MLSVGSAAASSNLLRNDELSSLNPPSHAKTAIFTGGRALCSLDPTVTLDVADPGDCSSATPGEGAREATNGSDDGDDLYVPGFGSGLDPGAPVLADAGRPLVFYQVENAGGPNSLRLTKNRAAGTVFIEHDLGACCVELACSDLYPSACLDRGATYQGDDSSCSDTPPPCLPGVGVCCDGSACRELDYVDCEALGGVYVGERLSCTALPYCEIGACCTAAGCFDETPACDCDGVFGGNGTTCADRPPPCPTEVGACCTSSGCIDDVSAASCAADHDGRYAGDGYRCSDSPDPCCGAPVGACCAPANCFVADENSCHKKDGVYAGDGTACEDTPLPCAATGPCCLGASECEDGWRVSSCPGDYLGDGTACSDSPAPCAARPIGACCTGLGCSETVAGACAGTWLGAGTDCSDIPAPCPPVGACCDRLGDGCSVSTRAWCETRGSIYVGDGSSCADVPAPCAGTGACCQGTECSDGRTPEGCRDGVYQGDGSSCVDIAPCGRRCFIGACCDGSGGCTDVSGFACQASGGRSLGPGTSCSESSRSCQVGACCVASRGRCYDQLACDCTGTFLGPGTSCSDRPPPCPGTGACCLEKSSCRDGYNFASCGEFPSQFWEESGVYLGDGTSCSDSALPCAGVPVGACCDLWGCRDELTEAHCIDVGGLETRYHGDGSSCCDVWTSCAVVTCCDDFGCFPSTSLACDLWGTPPSYSEYSCGVSAPLGCYSETGACCYGSRCEPGVFRTHCEDSGGQFVGPDTACIDVPSPCVGIPTGACCTETGCIDGSTAAGCGGSYAGDGTWCHDEPSPCRPLGLCCVPAEGCVDPITEAGCTLQGGAWLGSTTSCTTRPPPCPGTGACCWRGCEDGRTASSCRGTYKGDGISCADVPSPCRPPSCVAGAAAAE